MELTEEIFMNSFPREFYFREPDFFAFFASRGVAPAAPSATRISLVREYGMTFS